MGRAFWVVSQRAGEVYNHLLRSIYGMMWTRGREVEVGWESGRLSSHNKRKIKKRGRDGNRAASKKHYYEHQPAGSSRKASVRTKEANDINQLQHQSNFVGRR